MCKEQEWKKRVAGIPRAQIRDVFVSRVARKGGRGRKRTKGDSGEGVLRMVLDRSRRWVFEWVVVRTSRLVKIGGTGRDGNGVG